MNKCKWENGEFKPCTEGVGVSKDGCFEYVTYTKFYDHRDMSTLTIFQDSSFCPFCGEFIRKKEEPKLSEMKKKELIKIIDKMKCCGNCENSNISCGEEWCGYTIGCTTFSKYNSDRDFWELKK